MRALWVDIYKHPLYADCSNHGISERYNEILLLCPDGNVEVKGDEPNLCKVVKWKPFGNETYYHIEPVAKPNGVGWMSGGSVVYSCDSRYRDITNGYPLSLHDRTETQMEYDALSR